MTPSDAVRAIRTGDLDPQFAELYGAEETAGARARFERLIERAASLGVHGEVRLFSTPGRTELGGNHTDHNNGKVIAASIHRDSIAAVEAAADQVVELHSEGFDEPFIVDVSDLRVHPEEHGSTSALIRGIAARLSEQGYRVGGMRGALASNVLRGSGLSSSASIEVLIGTLFNGLYNEGRLQPLALALAGQFAENVYFGKPCGLMDQLACATGGIVGIDFADPLRPVVERVTFEFQRYGYALLVVDTGGAHDDLTGDYAAIPSEMRSIAQAFGKAQCREISEEQVMAALPSLRRAAGDRALLRVFHFFDDNERVDRQIAALRRGDVDSYLEAVRESGASSWQLLQNCWSPHVSGQPIPLALAVSARLLGSRGAARVHGGGFAGTIQAYVPQERAQEYRDLMEAIFGAGAATPLRVRNRGTVELTRRQ